MKTENHRELDCASLPSLSLVIPAYNEAATLPTTLEASWSYLASQPYETELIVVDDGSSDDTATVCRAFAASHPDVRVLEISHGGKAAALQAGMLAANGDLIAFSDADLATPLTHLAEFREAIDKGADVVIGSREGTGAHRIGEPGYRHLMGRVFNAVVRLLLLRDIQDTQCGFKLFRRDAARLILGRTRLYATTATRVVGPRVTAFDVELLVVARRQGLEICVLPVVWTYGPRTNVNPARDSWHNLVDVVRVKIYDMRGLYA